MERVNPGMPDAKRKEAGKLRVLVVGTSRLMTSAWSAAIGSSSTIETVGEVTSPEEALALVPHSDVVLFCALTQVEAGVEWVRVITRAFPESRILAVGIPNLEHVILGYVEAGACAYVSDEETIDCVLESLSGAVHGQAYVAPEVAPALIARLARLRQAYVEPESLGSRLGALTPREREILELIAQNLGNRQIADRLLIEIGTVKKPRAQHPGQVVHGEPSPGRGPSDRAQGHLGGNGAGPVGLQPSGLAGNWQPGPGRKVGWA
jgi:two-component system response regulator DegU